MKKLGIVLLFALGSPAFNFCKAQYTILHSFNDTLGARPIGSLTLSGKMMYGMTASGGAYTYGCIFSIDTNGNKYKDLFDFNGTNNGKQPQGSLTLSGGVLYGMAEMGGANNDGLIFKIDTNGNGYKDLLDFNGSLSPKGEAPYGALLLLGGKLYGMTSGMFNSDGNIFSIDTNGNGYKDLLDFNATIGVGPFGSLLLSNGVMYGMTNGGGPLGAGVIFKIDTNGNGFKDLLDFNDTNGLSPHGSLIISGSILYGMTSEGGVNIEGNVFSIDTNGSSYKDLFDFNDINGQNPLGSLVRVGGVLYGTTNTGGGSNNDGCIFSIDTNGSGFEELIAFNGTNGALPYWGSLTTSGNVVYGVATGGGIYNNGVIFKYLKTDDLGINNLSTSAASINVYPNPGNGQFTLVIAIETKPVQTVQPGGQSPITLEVYNVLGEKVYSQLITGNPDSYREQFTINLSGQPNGVYLYKVLSGDGSFIGEGKLVIQK